MEGLQVRNMTIRRPRKAVLLFKTSFPGPLHTSAQPIQSDIKLTAIDHCAIEHGWKVVKENLKQSIINVLASNLRSLWFCKPQEDKGIH